MTAETGRSIRSGGGARGTLAGAGRVLPDGAGREDELDAAAGRSRGARPVGDGAMPGFGAWGDDRVEERGHGRRRVALLGLLLFLIVIVGLAAAAAWLLLPSATVTVVVRPEPMTPLAFTVRADPAAKAPDETAGVVPAERPTFPISAKDTFPATGTKVSETKATGSVRWQNCDPTRSYTIPSGTTVRTRGGVAFVTGELIFLPVAVLSGNPPSIACQTRDVSVTAAQPGTAGNVAAGSIVVVPGAYNSVVIRVSNPAATSGGTHTETKLVTKKDVDAAVKKLTARLDSALAASAKDPATVGTSATLFPATASRTAGAPSPDPATLVGSQVGTFDLALSATGSVTTVDTSLVDRLAADRLSAAVQPGWNLIDGTADVRVGTGTVSGTSVSFPVTASAQVVRPVNAEAVRRAVAGKSLAAARAALAELGGEATIETWPSWVGTIPTLEWRLTVVVRDAAGAVGAGQGSGAASPSPAGSGSGSDTGSSSPLPVASP